MHSSSRTKESVLNYYELAFNSYKEGGDFLERGDCSTAISKFEFAIRQIEENNPQLSQKHDNVITYQFETNKNAILEKGMAAIASTSAIGITETKDDGVVWLLVFCRNHLGYAYCMIDRYKAAMNEFQFVIKLINTLDEKDDGDNLSIAQCHINIGEIFAIQEKYTKAIKETELACAILESFDIKTDDDRRKLADCRHYLGSYYYYQDNFNAAITQFELTIEELNRIEEINEIDKHLLATANGNIGNIYSDQNNSKEAIARLELAILILEQMENKEQSGNEQLVEYYEVIGEEYYKQYKNNLSKLNQLEKQLQLPQSQLIDEKNEKPTIEMKSEKSALLANSLLSKSKTKSSEGTIEINEPGKLTFGQ